MAIIGGFMGGYAVLLRADFLGNAQTSNLLLLIFAIFGHSLSEVLLRLLAFFVYILGGMTFVFVKKKLNKNPKIVSLIITSIGILIMSFLGEDINPILGLMPIFYMMSFQWNAFPGDGDYVSATIFSTNNTRQVSLSLAEFLCDGDRTHLHKTRFFLGTLISFHIGVAISYITVMNYSIKAILFAYIFVATGALILYEEYHSYKEEKNTSTIHKTCQQ